MILATSVRTQSASLPKFWSDKEFSKFLKKIQKIHFSKKFDFFQKKYFSSFFTLKKKSLYFSLRIAQRSQKLIFWAVKLNFWPRFDRFLMKIEWNRPYFRMNYPNPTSNTRPRWRKLTTATKLFLLVSDDPEDHFKYLFHDEIMFCWFSRRIWTSCKGHCV